MTINVIKAARICIEAWKCHVSNETCAKCFQKYGISWPLFGPPPYPNDYLLQTSGSPLLSEQDVAADIYDMVLQLKHTGHVWEALYIGSFLE
jgi:hypothetical protein